MKKILTILASATTLFAFGDLPTGTSFENFKVGDISTGPVTVGAIVNTDDIGNQDGTNKYWYSEAPETDELGVITNDVAGSGVSRPDMFADFGNSKSLQIETTSPLFRTALPNKGAPTSSGDGVSNVTAVAIGDGIYLDTLVKFTAADDVFSDDLPDGDKIAIEYVEREAETNVVGDVTNVVDAITAFVIRAGYIDGGNTQTNYLAAVPNGFDKNEWHRLTVRSIANVGGGYVGFVVYLDQVPLEYATSVAAGNAAFIESLNSAVTANFYNENIHALYPSAVRSGDNKTTITSVAFSGNGSIDDVVFTATKPNFIANSEAVNVTFSKDSGVTAISVKVGEADPVAVDMTTLTAMLPAGTTAFKVTATIDEANGYTFDKMTVGEDVYDANPANITNYVGAAIAITTARNNFNLFDENGGPILGSYQKLSDALAVQGVAKIQLAHDYDVLAVEGNDFAGYSFDGEIVLDLAGNDINGGDDSAGVSLFTVTDTFTIIDSVGGGAITYDTQYGYAIIKLDGSDVFVGASTGDAGATFNGKLFESNFEGKIIRGYIDDANNAEAGVFAWSGFVDSKSTLSDAAIAGYWVVTPKGGSTTFALTTTGGANATVTTSPANVSALTEATQVTITATAEQDYTYDGVDLTGTDWIYDSNDDAISMTTNISKNTEIAVPNAVAEQSSDEWPTGKDLDDAAGKAAGDLFPGITNALATADAKAVATWAAENSVAYADKGSILPDAFLLDCANTQQAIDEAAADFKITAITVDGDTVTFTPADGDDYGNGKVVIEGSVAIGTGASWHPKAAGDHFFKATLVVKPVPVATP